MSQSSSRWTNESVAALAHGADPIAAIVAKARELTLQAMEEGWAGPPFDPVDLARRRNIAVHAREDIDEARTVAGPDGTFVIEFNPNRPRGRIRYSIAHEIAHTFFPDCADQIRNRVDKSAMSGDEWQLEMLCNIAAAELIMPVGSFADLRDRRVSIDELMVLRREYDVSTEALLLRFVRLTQTACALFAASRLESGQYIGRYKVDYAVGSAPWHGAITVGAHLPDGTILGECTAIGFTAKGDERWNDQPVLHLECVGVTPYPTRVYPRVLGLATDPSDIEEAQESVAYVFGDALQPRGKTPQIIAHIVNDRATTWGAGFAKKVAQKFAPAQIDFRRWGAETANLQLGRTHFFGDPSGIEIASMIAQQGFGPSEQPRIRYPALQACLAAVAERALAHGATVHMPRIGCGQAGGKWEVVGEIVELELVRRHVPVTVYDLPGGYRGSQPPKR